MKYRMAKNHVQASVSTSKQPTVCASYGEKQRKPKDTVAVLNKIVEEEGEDGEKLKEELSGCQHFVVDTEMENGRHKVFIFQLSKLDAKIINEKLEEVFDSAAKLNVAVNLFLVMSKPQSIGFTTHAKTIFCSRNRINCV